MEAPQPPHTLSCSLGPAEVLFLTFSALSPAMSVFIFGDGLLHLAGTGAATAVIVGGIIAAIMAVLYAELGAAFPEAGGIYPSLIRTLGPFWSFPYITMMMVLAPALVAFTVLGFADYVRQLAPDLPTAPICLVSLALACGVAVLRIRTGALVTGLFLAVEALALAALTVVSLTHPARSLPSVLLHPILLDHGALRPATLATVGLATVSGIFATAGASWAMYFGEEMKDAQRRIGPLIAWTGPLAAVVIAGPITLMVLATKDPAAVLAAPAPMAAFIASAGGRALATLVSLGLVAAIFNALVVSVLGYSRLFYATGRDGIWPAPVNRLLARINPVTRAPVVATLVLAVCSAGLMLLGEQRLLVLSAAENIPEYLLMAIALLVGRPRGLTGRDYRTWLHPLAPLFGLAAMAGMIVADWLDPDAGRPSLILIAVLFAASLAYRRLRPATPARPLVPAAEAEIV